MNTGITFGHERRRTIYGRGNNIDYCICMFETWKLDMITKFIRYLLVQFFYYAGDLCLWAFERLNPDNEIEITKCDFLFNGYQYFMNKSSELDIYQWEWKEPNNHK